MAEAKTSSATAPAHTPGPWSYSELNPDLEDVAAYRIDGNHMYESVADVFFREDESETLANARLIASSPDLLDACRLAVISMMEALDGNSPGWMDNMRADLDFIEKAVAKAA